MLVKHEIYFVLLEILVEILRKYARLVEFLFTVAVRICRMFLNIMSNFHSADLVCSYNVIFYGHSWSCSIQFKIDLAIFTQNTVNKR